MGNLSEEGAPTVLVETKHGLARVVLDLGCTVCAQIEPTSPDELAASDAPLHPYPSARIGDGPGDIRPETHTRLLHGGAVGDHLASLAMPAQPIQGGTAIGPGL